MIDYGDELYKQVFAPILESQLSDKYNCPKCNTKPMYYFADVHTGEETAKCPNCGFEYELTE